MKSDNIKTGIAKTPHRGLLMASGVSRKNMKAPFIGIASSFSDLVPGHIGMRDLERQIEKGIHSAGGQAFIFGVPAICDGIAMGHNGMRYSLPSRDLIADCVESVASAHQLDGVVLLSNCDKITPGMLIGALRLNIPCLIVTAGPMLDGECREFHKLTMVTGSFEAVGKFRNGEITEEELLALEEETCPSAGACPRLPLSLDMPGRSIPAPFVPRPRQGRGHVAAQYPILFTPSRRLALPNAQKGFVSGGKGWYTAGKQRKKRRDPCHAPAFTSQGGLFRQRAWAGLRTPAGQGRGAHPRGGGRRPGRRHQHPGPVHVRAQRAHQHRPRPGQPSRPGGLPHALWKKDEKSSPPSSCRRVRTNSRPTS